MMNQKILELMQQAGSDSSGKWMGINHAEKFAELIVRECASLAYDGPGGILEHFGVEE